MPHISQNKNVVQKPVEFKEQWLVKFGLEVSTRDFGTSKVTSVLCLFCKQWERDDGETDADGKEPYNTSAVHGDRKISQIILASSTR
jgi:hypothetical protein